MYVMNELFALQPDHLIGRVKETQQLEWALNPNERGTRILLYVGPGGIGKTRLIQHGILLAAKLNLPSVQIDLYHPDNRSNSGIEASILNALDPEERHFKNYRRERSRFEELRSKAYLSKQLEELRERLTTVFAADLNDFCEQHRVLLTFDTAELIEFENEVVQHIGKIRDITIEVKGWLMSTLPRLRNCAVVIAGRGPRPNRKNDPRESLWKEFRTVFKRTEPRGLKWEEHPLDPFDEQESIEYLLNVAQVIRARTSNEDNAQAVEYLAREYGARLYQVTEGYPIRLGLMLDVAVREPGFVEDLFEKDVPLTLTWNKVAPRVIDALERMPPIGEQTTHPVKVIMRMLAATRYGLDGKLVAYLNPEWETEACHRYMDVFRTLSFVKTRQGTDELFLHDEIYEILETYQIHIQDNHASFQQIYYEITNYYRNLLAQGNHTPRQQRALKLKILHYLLRAKPKEGYQYYQWESEAAIYAHETGFDMQLRDEQLRFVDDPFNENVALKQGLQRDIIDRDSAIRWIKRHIARGRYELAKQVAESIIALGQSNTISSVNPDPDLLSDIPYEIIEQSRLLFKVNSPLFWAQVLIYYGQALTYVVNEDAAIPIAQKALDLLALPGHRSEQTVPESRSDEWLRIRIAARAHVLLAYAYRRAGRYLVSLKHSLSARHYYRLLGNADFIRGELTGAINEGAYTYALLGDTSSAELWIQDALQMREKLKQAYPLGLTKNSRGLIYLLCGQPFEALPYSREAYELFVNLDDARGRGLSSNTLGMIYRALANRYAKFQYESNEDNISKATRYFEEAEISLTRAINVFGDEAPEPSRLATAYMNLGRVYRDQGLFERERSKSSHHCFEKAQWAFEEAIKSAEGRALLLADIYEDIADFHYRWGNYQEAAQYLDMAQAYVPTEYHLEHGLNTLDDSQRVDLFWQVMGKIYIDRALLVFQPLPQQEPLLPEQAHQVLEAVRLCALAIGCFLQYSSHLWLHKDTFQRIYQHLNPYSYERLKGIKAYVSELEKEYGINLQQLHHELDRGMGLEAGDISF